MSVLRLRGADTMVTVMGPNASGQLDVQQNLTDVAKFNATLRFEKLEQRFLGEQTVRTDEIFAGCAGKTTLQLHDQDFGVYILGIQSRARRINPTYQFNFVSTFNFPNGEQPVMTFPDVNFGDIPLDIPSAKDYVTMDLDWICSEFDFTESG
jgi:hypothetical protein